MTPQNYYKERKVRKLKSVNERLIKQLVQTERAVQPRIGGLKLYHQLKTELEKAGVRIGRDRFFKVLKHQRLLLKAFSICCLLLTIKEFSSGNSRSNSFAL